MSPDHAESCLVATTTRMVENEWTYSTLALSSRCREVFDVLAQIPIYE